LGYDASMGVEDRKHVQGSLLAFTPGDLHLVDYPFVLHAGPGHGRGS